MSGFEALGNAPTGSRFLGEVRGWKWRLFKVPQQFFGAETDVFWHIGCSIGCAVDWRQ